MIDRHFSIDIPAERKCVNLGCGPKHLEGYINIDMNPKLKPDIVRDIEKGLPFDDNSIDMIYSTHFMEHVSPDKIDFVMLEIWRVLKPNGKFNCIVPIDKSLFSSPYHKSFWNEFTPIFFTEWNNKEISGYDFNLIDGQVMQKTNIYSDQFFFILEAVKEKEEDSKNKTETKNLNLGSGNRKLPVEKGWINIDIDETTNPDIVRDLDEGLPFDDSSIDKIYTSHAIEHIDDIFFFMHEIWRVSKPDAMIEIIAPNHAHLESIYANHKRFTRPQYFDMWTPIENYYDPVMNCNSETMGAEFISLNESIIENCGAIKFTLQVVKEGGKLKEMFKKERENYEKGKIESEKVEKEKEK